MILVEIAGFLGADAEERFTATGKRVVSLRVATKVRHSGADETVWWRVNIWGDRYDKMLPYLKKGSPVIIVGDMGKPETYTAKDGSTAVSLTLTAEIIKFSPFGKPEGREGGASYNNSAAPAAPSAPAQQESYATYGAAEPAVTAASDDLPF